MALEQKLSLKVSQKLVMTPSLQQAIKLLQLSRMELEKVLNQELVENPMLEDRIEAESVEESEEADELMSESQEQEDEELDHEEAIDEIDLEAYFDEVYESSGYRGPSSVGPPQAPPIENTLSREPDLYDQLLWQVHMTELPEQKRVIAELIVGNVDPRGFLVATVEEICEMGRDEPRGEPFSEEEVLEALEFVQSLDPPGVACRDLRESLLRQLEAVGEEETLAYEIIDQHWERFTKRRYPDIAKALGLELGELEPHIERIKQLETRPGRKFTSEQTHYVEPDVEIVQIGDEYQVRLNDDGLPRLRVSKAYRNMLRKLKQNGKQGEEAHEYLKEKMRSAMWIIKSVDQRQRTIYKVANSILKQQRGFFQQGIEQLRPMVLRDVADDIEMHESTVSRVVSNKYIDTPRGLLPMKFFFHSGIDRDYGEDISSLTVKKRIEEFIEEEDAKNPLSDSAIAERLHEQGINIARRTVAKYRDELGIPASTDRKAIF